VNCKKKSRRRFFLLMRSRNPPISSEFRRGVLNPPQPRPPRYATAIRSYVLNFHNEPRGLTVSWERYTLGFPVCYGSPRDVFAASSGFVHLYTLRFKEERTVMTCHVARPHLLTQQPYHPFDATAKLPTAHRTSP